MLQAGDAMPRARIADDAGKEVDTAEFLGSPLVLWFYPKDATPG